jgi:taurine dioxygenase
VLAQLPVDLRDRVEHARILNVYDFSRPTDRPMRDADLSPGSPSVELPFVRRHPVTGEAVVAANEMHTDRVLDVPAEQSAALLEAVLGTLYAPGHVYEHHWRVGDLVVWDNVAIHHGRHAFASTKDGGEERTLQRVALGTRSAHEMVPNLDELLTRSRA